MIDPRTLAHQIAAARADRRIIDAPTTCDPAFDLAAAYAVEADRVRLKRVGGHLTVGRNVGFANKAIWRVLEPEIVFKMQRPLGAGDVDGAAVLGAVEWIALGFEIIDCVFPDWKFQPPDFVASVLW